MGCFSGFTGFGSTCYPWWLFLFSILAPNFLETFKQFEWFWLSDIWFFSPLLFAPFFTEMVLDYFANDPSPHQREKNHYCFLTFGLGNSL